MAIYWSGIREAKGFSCCPEALSTGFSLRFVGGEVGGYRRISGFAEAIWEAIWEASGGFVIAKIVGDAQQTL